MMEDELDERIDRLELIMEALAYETVDLKHKLDEIEENRSMDDAGNPSRGRARDEVYPV